MAPIDGNFGYSQHEIDLVFEAHLAGPIPIVQSDNNTFEAFNPHAAGSPADYQAAAQQPQLAAPGFVGLRLSATPPLSPTCDPFMEEWYRQNPWYLQNPQQPAPFQHPFSQNVEHGQGHLAYPQYPQAYPQQHQPMQQNGFNPGYDQSQQALAAHFAPEPYNHLPPAPAQHSRSQFDSTYEYYKWCREQVGKGPAEISGTRFWSEDMIKLLLDEMDALKSHKQIYEEHGPNGTLSRTFPSDPLGNPNRPGAVGGSLKDKARNLATNIAKWGYPVIGSLTGRERILKK